MSAIEIQYSSEKVRAYCTNPSKANAHFGGNKMMGRSLLSRINAIECADFIKDIVVQSQFRFHKLHNDGKSNLEGWFSIDVKTRKEAWRIILRPLDADQKPYNPCNIDEVASVSSHVEILEVSKHYE